MFGIFEDDFPFPQVGYVNFLEGNKPFIRPAGFFGQKLGIAEGDGIPYRFP